MLINICGLSRLPELILQDEMVHRGDSGELCWMRVQASFEHRGLNYMSWFLFLFLLLTGQSSTETSKDVDQLLKYLNLMKTNY